MQNASQITTHPETSHPKLQSTDQTFNQQSNAGEVYKSIFDKRRMGVESLKGWDLNTKHNLERVKSLVDNLFIRLEESLGKSRKRNEKISKYFESMRISLKNEINLKEEKMFALMKVVEVAEGKEAKEETALSESIGQFDREFKKYMDGFKDMQSLFKSQINGKILADNLKPHEEKYKTVQQKIIAIQQKIKKTIASSEEKFEEMIKISKEATVEGQRDKRPRTNTFEQVNSFVRKIDKLKGLIKEYGLLFLQAYEQAKVLETNRLGSIKAAFLEYIEIMGQFFGKQNDKNFIFSQAMFMKINEALLTDNMFNLHLLLRPSETEIVLKRTGAPALNIQVLREFFIAEPHEQNVPELMQLFYIKKYQAYLIEPRMTTAEVEIYMTIDYYCSVYKVKGRKNQPEIIMSVPLEDVQVISDRGKDSLTFKYVEKHFLWKTKKQLSFLFNLQLDENIMREIEEAQQVLRKVNVVATFNSQLNSSQGNFDSRNQSVSSTERRKNSEGHKAVETHEKSGEKTLVNKSSLMQNELCDGEKKERRLSHEIQEQLHTSQKIDPVAEKIAKQSSGSLEESNITNVDSNDSEPHIN
jgi:hypothetical protein